MEVFFKNNDRIGEIAEKAFYARAAGNNFSSQSTTPIPHIAFPIAIFSFSICILYFIIFLIYFYLHILYCIALLYFILHFNVSLFIYLAKSIRWLII